MNKKKHRRGDRFRNPTKILAFDSQLKLAAVFSSYNVAEKLLGIPHQDLYKACKGERIAMTRHYWRELEENDEEAMLIESEDLGKLTLLEYDKEIGVEREIYCSQLMKRGQVIPESEYERRFQFIKSNAYKKWKDERFKRTKDE